ncbi:MAG: maleylpyruvate isomerase family mycothiol-dependent enzyme [Actinomycetia bacterium]|nr:maleylpyruvate isomerase family mycothiol-dependent enzyme [Actinomycetes bacterium]
MTLPWDATSVIRDESDRFSHALLGADPDSPVPTCPGWTVADLAWHLTEVHLFWAAVLESGATTDEHIEAIEAAKPARPASLPEILDLRAAATTRLLAALDQLDDSEARWTWSPQDQSVGFTRRMQTHEATMHRIDAEQAAGADVSPIEPAVAAGAVTHALDVMWHWIPEWGKAEVSSLVTVEATDTGDRWVAELGRWRGTGPESGTEFDEGFSRLSTARPAPGAADLPHASVTGTAVDLARWMWGRGGQAEVRGEDAAVTAVGALVDQGMP